MRSTHPIHAHAQAVVRIVKAGLVRHLGRGRQRSGLALRTTGRGRASRCRGRSAARLTTSSTVPVKGCHEDAMARRGRPRGAAHRQPGAACGLRPLTRRERARGPTVEGDGCPKSSPELGDSACPAATSPPAFFPPLNQPSISTPLLCSTWGSTRDASRSAMATGRPWPARVARGGRNRVF